MLRRLVRSYYRLRYFPRLLIDMLTGISNAVAGLHRYEAEQINQLMSAHEERLARVNEEFVAFCDDAIRAMMTVSASIADLDTRIVAIQQGLQRLDNAAVDSQSRMAGVHQSLQRLHDQADPQSIAALADLVRQQAAQTDRIEHLLGQPARPVLRTADHAAPAKASDGPGEAAVEDDARLSRV